MAFKSLALALAALSFHRVSAFTRLQARDGNEPFPFCNPATSPDCIVGGKYVKPDLNISDEPNAGNQAYLTYLPTHTYTLSQWAAGKYPEECHRTIVGDGFNPTDFTVHNVTYSDCPSSPWVICVSRLANKTPVQIATEVGRMPAGIRQATAYVPQGSDLLRTRHSHAAPWHMRVKLSECILLSGYDQGIAWP